MRVRIRLVTSALSAVLAVGLLLPGAVSSDVYATGPSAVAGGIRNVAWYSSNWAGYVSERGPFTSVTGHWTVPSVSTAWYGFSAVWLGIGGVSENDLIQVGTEQDSRNGRTYYSAWWEILPAPATRISMTVRPGDKVTASIVKVGGRSWKISISIAGRGSFTTTRTYNGSADTAEWIVEAPTVGWRTAPLAHHSRVRFDVLRANKLNPRLSSSQSGAMVQRGVRVATPSIPDPQRDGFAVARSASAPPAPD